MIGSNKQVSLSYDGRSIPASLRWKYGTFIILKVTDRMEVDMHRAIAEAFKIFCGTEVKTDDWLWCKRCQRCYKASEFRKLENGGKIFLLCHYRDCRGDLPLDSRLWRKVITRNPNLPGRPVRGQTYQISKTLNLLPVSADLTDSCFGAG
jgi:hypothetical protein